MDKLKIINLKAWIVLPEITEIVVAESITGYDYNPYIVLKASTYNFKDYYEKLRIYMLQNGGKILDGLEGEISELYLNQIIRPSELILYFVTKCEVSTAPHLGKIWTCTNPGENLEKLLLEVEKEANNEQS